MSPNILIVDDSLTVRMNLAEAFEAARLPTLTCATIQEAKTALARKQFALIVLDVLLPDGDGVTFLTEIREASSSSGAAVMLLSTEAEVRDRVRGLKMGADEYIGKPCEASYIIARAHELLRRDGVGGIRTTETILIIDDSPTFRGALRQALEDASYRVLDAASGEEGLRVAAEAYPTAIIVDGQLPGIDGTAVVRRIRMDVGLRRTPCLLLTASEEEGAEVAALDAGADAFVRKDEEIAVMLARLGAVLRTVDGPQAGGGGKMSLVGPKKILLVDDSETFLQASASRLRADGYEVVLARCGQEALELLSAQTVDCILLDLVMPEMDGQDTCRRIKASSTSRDLPVIMLTGVEDRETMIRSLDAGADDYILKSVEFDVLRARILAQIRRKQFEDENRFIRERLVRQEMEAMEARAARELSEIQAVMAERKRSEAQMHDLQAELAHVSRWNAMGMMAASLAHELNQPLTAVKNYMTAARRTIDSLDAPQARKAQALMDQAAEQTMQAGAIIRNLREFIEKRDTNRSAQNINTIVEEAIALGLIGGGQLDLKMQVDLATGLQPVWANKIQIQQVLINLFRNSVEAMHSALRRELMIATGSDEPGFVRVAVSDTGPGIAPDVLSRLFQPFTTTKQDGMGIGLKICQSIIEAHGGKIWLTPRPDAGVTFRFRLPVAPALGGRHHV